MFEDALKTYVGDVVTLTFASGRTDSGRLYIGQADNGSSLSLAGELFRSQVNGSQSLVKMERVRYYRTDAIIGVEQVMEDPL